VTDDIAEAIYEYVKGSTLLRGHGPLDGTTPLSANGVLDSIAIVELLLFLEVRFGIEFATRDLNRRRLETIEQIVQLVAEKRVARMGELRLDTSGT
jgi:acyl carrier protein